MNFITLNLFIDVIIYSFIPLGLWFSFRIMKYPDLAVEQVFVLGGVIFGICMLKSVDYYIIPLIIISTSFLLGITNSTIRYSLRINPIILSLIMSYIYYSISLSIMGKPSLSYGSLIENQTSSTILIFLIILFIVITAVTHIFLKSNFGNKVIATGCNHSLSQGLGLRSYLYGAVGLSISYCIILSAGALYSLKLRNSDISYGGGFLLMGLFIVLLCRVFDKRISIIRNAVLILFTSLVYTAILQIVIIINLPPELTRGFYAIMLLFLVLLSPKSNYNFL